MRLHTKIKSVGLRSQIYETLYLFIYCRPTERSQPDPVSFWTPLVSNYQHVSRYQSPRNLIPQKIN